MRAAPATTYGPPAKWLHWIVGLIVLMMIPVGIIMGNLPEGALQDRLYFIHESFGVTVLVLMVLRFANRLRGAPPPDPVLTRTERALSTAVHHMLYVMLFLVPILGWLALSAYGLRPPFFGLFELPPLLAKNEALSERLFRLHGLGGFVIGGLIVLHLAGAAMHAFIRQDGVVWRMLPVSWRRTA
jgi:cytochrome b561